MHSASQNKPAYQKVIDLNDAGSEAFVVIDSYLEGGGTGGIRMGESVTLAEVADLAHEMTLIFAWLNIPRGGAKSGITYEGEMSEARKDSLLKEFGKSISDLLQSHDYVAGMDLGIGPTELATIMSSAGMQSGMSNDKNAIDSNYFTALTVFVSLKTLLHEKGEELSDVKVLIEGVGKVSTHLMRMIVETGARVTGVSTIAGSIFSADGIKVEELLSLKQTYGDECVKRYPSTSLLAPEDLYMLPADVLIPGARPNSINENNIDAIKARFIVPIANIPARPEIEKMLYERGVHYIPGFVSNSGGIFCWYLARLSGQSRENIIRQGFAERIRGLIDDADRRRLPIAELARSQAQDNANRMMLENSSLLNRTIGIARKLAPRRIAYVALSRIFGSRWGSRDSVFCRWYFDARYFR